ncbi:hypothetical protein Aglo01_48100 [Actinokineospora globicatena]|nr:hypothetical protein Aglo01_48100 [Actinokineospora globicatena]GLW87157.1 hypothetical protein Aglo02_47960 [Actinokineospora globicatena]
MPDHLVRDPVGVSGNDGAQHLVPFRDIGDRRAQCPHVDLLGEPQQQRDVVGRVRSVKLVHEPQPPLRERQWHAFRSFHRSWNSHSGSRRQVFDHPGHRWRVEHRTDRDLDAEFNPRPHAQPSREQRSAT